MTRFDLMNLPSGNPLKVTIIFKLSFLESNSPNCKNFINRGNNSEFMKLLGALAVSAFLVSLISLSYLGLQISYGQSEQQNFTAPKFGISMQYPTD